MVRSASVMAASMRSGVIWSSAVVSETCEVTRDIQVVEHVHLAKKSMVPGKMREHLMLVVEAPANGWHGFWRSTAACATYDV